MIISPRGQRETGRDYAFRTLKENIIQLELEPGSMVSENELAMQMGLSRTPVREALMALAKVRLIEVYPQRGSAVAAIDYDLVEEACFMRGVLEVAVVELVCKTASKEQIVELEDNVALQERYLADGRMEALMQLDNDLHKLMFAIANKQQTWDMLSGFTVHFDRVRRMALDSPRNDRNVADHRAIVEAIAARDVQAAREAMETHLNRYRVDEALLRDRYPASYFKAE
ncbi:MAG: GntR family transcriptional regulator [Clostridia bacterium]|nr:GntR family transcriptional regulator [Clostridia bacterium]